MNNTILIVDENLPYLLNEINFATGGASVQSLNWTKGFIKNNLNVVILSSVDIINHSGIKTINLSRSQKQPRNIRSICYFWKILKAVKTNSIDYIYVSIPSWKSFFWGLICKILKIKYIQRVSNDYMTDIRLAEFNGKWRYKMTLWGMKFSELILCQNTYQENNLKLKYTKNKILKIYNPFEVPNNLPENCNGDYIAWIGIFQRQKNITALFQIAKNLPQYKFKIAGEAQKNIDNISITHIQKLRSLNNVEFVGFLSRNKIFNFLNSAFCLLNTSLYEGFTNTFLEAMAVGTPIIAHKNIDPDGIIKKHGLGVIVDDYNLMPEELAKLIKKGKLKFKNRGLSYLKSYHSPEILAKKLLYLINN